MSTRDQIIAELDRMSEAELEAVLAGIRHLLVRPDAKTGLLERLQRVRIDGPSDFAEHIDDYLSHPPPTSD